jgi:hypothetical protein
LGLIDCELIGFENLPFKDPWADLYLVGFDPIFLRSISPVFNVFRPSFYTHLAENGPLNGSRSRVIIVLGAFPELAIIALLL